jgi:hypothetical protein
MAATTTLAGHTLELGIFEEKKHQFVFNFFVK